VPRAELLGRRRLTRLVPGRQACYVALWESYSLEEIGELFGRHHTTILDGVRAAERRADADPAYAAQIAALLDPPTVQATAHARIESRPIGPQVRMALYFWGIAAPTSA
jgi:hypothetical protein